MPKLKIKTAKKGLTGVHLQALVFLILFYIFNNGVFLSLVANPNLYVSILGPFVFGIASGFIFLYLFSNKDFFSFMGVLEKDQRKKEKGYLAKFLKYGKIIACILVSQFGGPIFLALTVRFLFPRSANRYLIVFISTVVTTLFGVLLARGILSLSLW